jgi:putative transposase
MSNYRRRFVAGGTYFFTVVTEGRSPIFVDDHVRGLLGDAMRSCAATRPFETVATVLLPDHLHAMWTLPEGDADFSTRWSFIKSAFTRSYLAAGGVEQPISVSREQHRRRGIWQRRYWEHLIRDEEDFRRHVDYIHWNPVKHNHAACPHAWRWSSFQKWVQRGAYEPTWQCRCDSRIITPPDFGGMEGLEME